MSPAQPKSTDCVSGEYARWQIQPLTFWFLWCSVYSIIYIIACLLAGCKWAQGARKITKEKSPSTEGRKPQREKGSEGRSLARLMGAPLRCYFAKTLSSTRRFSCLPAAVLLSAIGLSSPKPLTIRLSAFIPPATRHALTASARRSDSFLL